MLGKRELSVSATSLKRSAITILCVLGVCALVFLIYSNALHSEFQFDDKQNIQENEHIRLTGISWQGLLDAGFRSHAWQRPIPNITFALNYYFHGYDTFGYHLVNVIIHLISGLFLFLTVRETVTIARQRNQSILITDSTNILLTASAVAMIWLVHPLATQSVTYVVQRMASMAAMFSIVSMYCYIRARMVTGRMTMWMMYVGCMIAWFLALGSKQISATLPFFIFLYEWYFFRDLDVSWMKRQLVPVMFLAAAGAAVMVLYLGKDPLQRILTFYEVRDFTPIQRVMTEWRVVIMYLGLIIFPHPDRLNLDYDFPLSLSLMNPPTTLLSLLVIIGLLGASVWIAKRERVISFAVFWYFGNLVIESSIIPAELVYEHRTYMPSMFMVLVAVLAAFRLLKPRWAQILFLCVVVATFSVWTYQRNLVWQSDPHIMDRCVEEISRQGAAIHELRIALMKRDRLDEAIPYFEKSVELAPNFPAVYRNLGHALSRKGRLDEAIEQYRHAVALMPGEISFILELGALLEKKGDLAGAAEVYQGARDRVEVVSALGRVLAQQGKYEEALRHSGAPWKRTPVGRSCISAWGTLRHAGQDRRGSLGL
jgi:hypothetical protein